MLMGLSAEDASTFLEKISAVAIVNQAVIKCQLAEMEVNYDNVVLFIGDFGDPTDPDHQGLIFQIQVALEQLLACKVFAPKTFIPLN